MQNDNFYSKYLCGYIELAHAPRDGGGDVGGGKTVSTAIGVFGGETLKAILIKIYCVQSLAFKNKIAKNMITLYLLGEDKILSMLYGDLDVFGEVLMIDAIFFFTLSKNKLAFW